MAHLKVFFENAGRSLIPSGSATGFVTYRGDPKPPDKSPPTVFAISCEEFKAGHADEMIATGTELVRRNTPKIVAFRQANPSQQPQLPAQPSAELSSSSRPSERASLSFAGRSGVAVRSAAKSQGERGNEREGEWARQQAKKHTTWDSALNRLNQTMLSFDGYDSEKVRGESTFEPLLFRSPILAFLSIFLADVYLCWMRSTVQRPLLGVLQARMLGARARRAHQPEHAVAQHRRVGG